MIGTLLCKLGVHKRPSDPRLSLVQWIAPHGPLLVHFVCDRIGCYENETIEVGY